MDSSCMTIGCIIWGRILLGVMLWQYHHFYIYFRRLYCVCVCMYTCVCVHTCHSTRVDIRGRQLAGIGSFLPSCELLTPVIRLNSECFCTTKSSCCFRYGIFMLFSYTSSLLQVLAFEKWMWRAWGDSSACDMFASQAQEHCFGPLNPH